MWLRAAGTSPRSGGRPRSFQPEVVVTRPPVPLSLKLTRRRSGPLGLIASVLVHVVVIGLLVYPFIRAELQTTAGTPGLLGTGGSAGGGGGGRRVAYISLPAYVPPAPTPAQPDPVVPPPEPVPVKPAPPPTPVPDTVATADTQAVTLASAGDSGQGNGTGSGTGGGSGGGSGGGIGPGNGPGSGEGTGGGTGRATAPRGKQLIVPPMEKVPKSLRGSTVQVVFHITAQGDVARVDVRPRIEDGDYARRFEEAMLGYKFWPALSPSGDAIPGTVLYRIQL